MSLYWTKFLRDIETISLSCRDRLDWRWAAWLILSIAIVLRLYGLDWDQGKLFHPDERALLMKVDEISLPAFSQMGLLLNADESPLNPRWFPYGTLPMYLLEIIQTAFSPFTHLDTYDLRIPGRLLSAAADVGTVMAVLALGIRLYSRRVAILASAFIALAVIHVQLSHFFAVDTFLAFFTVATMLFLGRVAYSGGLKYSALAGLCLGLALATKVSIAFLLIPFLLAHIMAAFSAPERQTYFPLYVRLRSALLGAIVGGTLALIALFVAMPYAFLDWSTFLVDVVEQSEIIRRVRHAPYTLQYVDTLPFIYHMKNLGLWGLGIPLGITTGAGLAFTVIHYVFRPNKTDLLMLSLVIPYLLFFGSLETKFMRYMLPATPFLALMGSRMLFWAWDVSGHLHRFHGRQIVGATIALVVVITALYSLAFTSIYTRPHSAVEASQWMTEHAPSGAIILREHWEESLRDMGGYVDVELPMYDPDTLGKLKLISEELARGDYLVLYSHRLYGTISRLPHRYPWSRAYYHALFSGDLGYVLKHSFTSYPSLLGISLLDDTFERAGLVEPTDLDPGETGLINLNLGYADESFVVYDHPKVLVFQRVVDKTSEEITQLILDYELSLEVEREKQPLMMSIDEARIQSGGGTWRNIVHPYSWPSRYPVLAWLLMVEFISILILPLAMVLFRSLPDRGFLLAKGLGLLLVAYVPWLLASVHWMSFSRASILLTLVLLGSASTFTLVRKGGKELLHFLRSRWPLLLVAEAVFLVAFAIFLAIRMAHPDIAHPWVGSTWLAGEKHMDLAYLTATVKSTFMPPYDPWYAGGYINYYYFGMVPLAVLIKSTGIAPSVAYNLAIPLLFALTVSLSFSLVYNLTELMRRIGSGRAYAPVVAGILAGIFVGILGNLDGLVQLLQGTVMVIFGNGPFPDFDYWRSARMMPPQISITEFPFWTFLYADLHAHMEAMPFTLLSLGIGLALIAGARVNERWWMSGGVLLLLALAVGSLATTNTWDYPTYLLIAVACIPLAVIARTRNLDSRAIREILPKSMALVGLSYFLFLPYHLRYVNAYTGVIWSKWQTPLYQYIGIHGLFVFLAITLVTMEALKWQRHGWIGTSSFSWLNMAKVWGPWLVVSGLGFSMFLAIGYHTVAFLGLLFVAIIALAAWGFKKWGDEAPYLLFTLLLLIVAVLLGIGVDLFTVQGDVDRMNTVFKFYIQAWILFGVVSAFVLWRVRGFFFSRPWTNPGKIIWLAAFSLLLVASAIYPILGTKALLGDRYKLLPLTLDGTAYMKVEGAVYPDPNGPIIFEWDYWAINWMQENISGSPVIVEAVTPLYRWGARVSVYTGLPTVVGWPWHQMQQRWDDRHQVESRVADVEELFSTTDLSRTMVLLEKYRVSYIYIGEQERLYYPNADMTKFDRMTGSGLELVYENPGVLIYMVKR